MKNLAKALSTFHDKMTGLEKDSKNPFFKSSYVSLDNILVSIKQPLKEANLIYIQMPSNVNGEPALLTRLIEIESGEFIESISPLIMAKQDPQAQGSAITYMRRYALTSLLGLNTETDDDANVAVRGAQSSTGVYNQDIEDDLDNQFNSAMNNDRV